MRGGSGWTANQGSQAEDRFASLKPLFLFDFKILNIIFLAAARLFGAFQDFQFHARGWRSSRDIPKGMSRRCDPGLAGGRGAAEEPLVVVGTGTVLFLQGSGVCSSPQIPEQMLLRLRCCCLFLSLSPNPPSWIYDPDLQPQLQRQRGEQPSPSVDFPVTANSWHPSSEATPSSCRFIQCRPSTFDITIISMFSELYIFLNAL